LVYDFCVIWNVFHVLNRVHCRLFSVFTAHGPQTQRQKILLAARVSVVLDCCVPDCTERTLSGFTSRCCLSRHSDTRSV